MPTPLGAAPRVHRTRFAGPPAARRLPSRFHDPPLFLTVAPIYLLTPPLLREAPFPTAPHHLRSGKRTRPPRDARRTASPLEPTVVKLLVQPWLSVPRAHISDVPTRPTRARAYGCLIEARRRLKKRLSGQLEHAEKDYSAALTKRADALARSADGAQGVLSSSMHHPACARGLYVYVYKLHCSQKTESSLSD